MSDFGGGRTSDSIVEFMNKENKAIVSEIKSLTEVTGDKPSFVLVGNPSNDVIKTALEKKAYLDFYWIASSEGQTEGSVLLVESGVVKSTLAAGKDLAKFVKDNIYPLVGQLNAEN